MEDIERLSKDANLAYYEMVNSNKNHPLTNVSPNHKTIEEDIFMDPDLSKQNKKI